MKTSFLWKLVLLVLLVCQTLRGTAQTDTQFWFFAPETTRDHDKEPGMLKVTALENDAHVTISMPANPDFQPIELFAPANSQVQYEFWDGLLERDDGTIAYERMLWTVENGRMDAVEGYESSFPNDWEGWTAGTPFNKGLLIESDQPVSVCYTVASRMNPETFNLKGRNALGNEFLIPSQDIYVNYHNTPNAREKADIVATEDSTVITIELTDNHDITGHTAGSVFTITLDRGQTYSLRSTSPHAAHHLGGTYISSNKPVAITISDDSIAHPEGSTISGEVMAWDLVGDQLLPISSLGTEYIAMHTAFHYSPEQVYNPESYSYRPFDTGQQVFIMAVIEKDYGTTVFVNGEPRSTLDRGEFVMLNIAENALHITADAPIYVYQFSSFRYELGSAVLPPVNCTGNRQVSFNKFDSYRDDDFLIQILTKKRYINDFSLVSDNENLTLDDLNWMPVNGTGNPDDDETWYMAVKNFQPYPSYETCTIMLGDPDGRFHLSIVDSDDLSCDYSYHASYNTLEISGPLEACQGDEVPLSSNQPGRDLMWYHESSPLEPFSVLENVSVSESGKYWAKMQYPGCISSDTITVDISSPEFELPENQSLCPGEELDLEFGRFTEGETFEWLLNGEDSGTSSSFNLPIEADNQYEIELIVTDAKGCSTYDNMFVLANPEPDIHIDDVETNYGQPYTYIVNDTFQSYRWQNISNDEEIIPENTLEPHEVTLFEPAMIALTITNDYSCQATDTSSFTWDIFQSIDKHQNSNDFSSLQIHPNPAKDGTIYFNRIISGGLYQIDGKLVTTFNETDHINIAGIKPGIYIVLSECGEVVRWVKQ